MKSSEYSTNSNPIMVARSKVSNISLFTIPLLFLALVTISETQKFINSNLSIVKSPTETIPAETIPALTLPTSQQNRSIMYIHTGKTGGTSLGYAFPSSCNWYSSMVVRKKCHMRLKEKKLSLLATLTKKEYHILLKVSMISRNFIKDNTTSFMFTLRTPVSRTVSAFNQQHIRNLGKNITYEPSIIFYEKCFPTVEELAMTLGGKRIVDVPVHWYGKNSTIACIEEAMKAIHGTINAFVNVHLNYNYQHYFKDTAKKYPEKEIFALRTEKLWEDISDLNVLLGGEDDTFDYVTDVRIDYGSSTKQVTSGLSEEGKKIVCCFLYKENEIYEHIMLSAVNLNDSVKESSLDKLYMECGMENRYELGTNFSWSEWAKEMNCHESQTGPYLNYNHSSLPSEV